MDSLHPPAPEDFALLPWGWTPPTPHALAGIKECGFNLAGFISAGNLDKVAQVGLKAIVFSDDLHVTDVHAELEDAEIEARVQSLVSQVKDHPAKFGYYLRDEPGVSIFPGLARWAAALKKADPGARPYLNLFPNYATSQQLGVDSYADHLEQYLTTVQPPFLSYDNYSLMEDGSLRAGYFENLETIRAAAFRHGIPFWNIVLANSHFRYAEPTPAGLRLQVYTSLAYGARGISFFTYFTPDNGNYRLAPVDPRGERTPTWDMLRDVLLQVHALAPAYLRLTNIHVFHTGTVPAGGAGIQTSRCLDDLSGGDFVVGEFEGPDAVQALMIVNKDLHHSAQFTLALKQPAKIERVSPYTGSAFPLGAEGNWLAPGQGVLLSIIKE